MGGEDEGGDAQGILDVIEDEPAADSEGDSGGGAADEGRHHDGEGGPGEVWGKIEDRGDAHGGMHLAAGVHELVTEVDAGEVSENGGEAPRGEDGHECKRGAVAEPVGQLCGKQFAAPEGADKERAYGSAVNFGGDQGGAVNQGHEKADEVEGGWRGVGDEVKVAGAVGLDGVHEQCQPDSGEDENRTDVREGLARVLDDFEIVGGQNARNHWFFALMNSSWSVRRRGSKPVT